MKAVTSVRGSDSCIEQSPPLNKVGSFVRLQISFVCMKCESVCVSDMHVYMHMFCTCGHTCVSAYAHGGGDPRLMPGIIHDCFLSLLTEAGCAGWFYDNLTQAAVI